MLAVRLPGLLAAQAALEQGERGIGREVERQDHGRGPVAAEGEVQHQPAQQEAQRDRAGVAHEDLGWMPVPEQIAGGRRGDDQRQMPERTLLAGVCQQQEVAERDGDRLAPRQSVDAVHEVEEIDEPQPGKTQHEALGGEGNDGQHAGLRRQRGQAQRHRHRLGGEADGGRQRAAVIDPRQGGKPGKARK